MSNGSYADFLKGIRRDLGNGFVHALDDIRQKVVEEAWTGQTMTPAHEVKSEFRDPMAWLRGPPAEQGDPMGRTSQADASSGNVWGPENEPPASMSIEEREEMANLYLEAHARVLAIAAERHVVPSSLNVFQEMKAADYYDSLDKSQNLSME